MRPLRHALFRLVCLSGGNFIQGGSWAGILWRQDFDAGPVLINPAISNVQGNAERMSEVAGGAG
jgi:hypothetical protein